MRALRIPARASADSLRRMTGTNRQPALGFDAPSAYTGAFCTTWQRRYWDMQVYTETKRLRREGVDVDSAWLAPGTGTIPADILFPDAGSRADFLTSFERVLSNDYPALAGTGAAILARPWKELSDTQLEAYARTLVDYAPLFGGRRLVDHMEGIFNVSANTVVGSTRVFVASGDRFRELARTLGYTGPINFRGLTAELPDHPGTYWIILARDVIESRSEYNASLMQFAELVTILTHEHAHVFQDLLAKRLGVALEPQSMEGAAVMEGQAEYAAITAMQRAGAAAHPRSPWRLFAAREGQMVERSPELLSQYTVGLPMVAAFDATPGTQVPLADLMRVVAGKQTMEQATERWAGSVR